MPRTARTARTSPYRRRAALAGVVVATVAGLLAAAPAPSAAATAGFDLTWVNASQALSRYLPDRYGMAHATFSSPAVGDVTGDGVLDLVHGMNDGFVYVYRATDGLFLNRFEVGAGPITSSPTLTDLNDDGVLDIIVGIMPTNETAAPRTIGGYTAAGALLFSKKTCTYPGKPCNVFSTMAVADLDGDLDEDIVATSQDHYLHAWRDDGSYLPGFPVLLYDTTWASPAVADLDGDGLGEIVVAADLDGPTCGHAHLGCQPPYYGGMMWLVESNGAVSRQRFLPGEAPYSSPAIGDLDGNGSLEVVIGAGLQFQTGHQNRVTAFDRFLQPIWAHDLAAPTMSSPALVDVDNNGSHEVAIGDSGGFLYLLHGNGVRRWTVCARNSPTICTASNVGIYGSPVAADVDADGDQEIVYVGESALQVWNGRGANGTSTVEYQHQLYTQSTPMLNQVSTPTVFAMNGKVRIAYHGLVDANRNLARDAGDRDGLWLFTAHSNLGGALDADWPAFRHGGRDRTGSAVGLPVVDVPNTAEGRYIAKAYADLLGRPVDAAAQRFWYGYLRANGRVAFTRALVFAQSCEWSRKVVSDLYLSILGRPADPSGLQYWTGRVCGGMRARDVAASIYGSLEYFHDPEQGGGTPAGYVEELYHDILERVPDQGGMSFWLVELSRRGQASIAFDFYQSVESRLRRVHDQYAYLLFRDPDPGGHVHWANVLIASDDLELTVFLTSSSEYFAAPCRRC